jgi:glutamate-1-semialdehyde 2,1-aminomutase
MSDIFRFHRRAQECIAQGALTNSKRPETFVKGVYPTHAKRGQGAWIYDHDGKKYLDFVTGLGTSLLGYAHPQVNDAIAAQMQHGASLSLSTHVELEAAEKLKECFPFVDTVKFLKTGTEACAAAIRIARAVTGRPFVLSDGYHGWSDDFVSLTSPALGVEPKVQDRRISKLNPTGPIPASVAAVIVEPVITDYSRERIEYLKDLRRRCTEAGALLIFDEVITGFRFPKFSVASYTGITPDLICLGKALANGMPLAAVGGKYSVMNGAEYFVSSSYAGETLSLAAAKKTMELLQSKLSIDDLWRKGEGFLEEFNAIWPEKIRIDGYPTRGAFVGDPVVKALFWQESCIAGFLFGPSWFLSFPAAIEIPNIMGTLKAILGRIQRGEVQLKGEMPSSPFAQKVREAQ